VPSDNKQMSTESTISVNTSGEKHVKQQQILAIKQHETGK